MPQENSMAMSRGIDPEYEDQRVRDFRGRNHPIHPTDFEWRSNRNDNLQGHRKTGDKHCFTWQFHGGQFTVIREIPGSARRFRIAQDVPLFGSEELEKLIQYDDEWIQFV